MVPGSVRICGLKRNSFSSDRAPKMQMQDSVPLSSWDSILVTLSSISSGTCVMYSSRFSGMDVLCDWLFVGCSPCVSLETALNFRLLLNVLILLKKEKDCTVVKVELFLFLNQFGRITEKCDFK